MSLPLEIQKNNVVEHRKRYIIFLIQITFIGYQLVLRKN